MKSELLPNFKYNGARSLILLQEKYLTEFIDVWLKAKKNNINLPETDDKDYESLESLLIHVLGASGRYIVWICDKLNLPNPNIVEDPTKENIQAEAKKYLDYILKEWHTPLINIEEDKFTKPSFTSNWGAEYCIDGMLEHAVMHPIRHTFQLRKLLEEQNKIINL